MVAFKVKIDGAHSCCHRAFADNKKRKARQETQTESNHKAEAHQEVTTTKIRTS